MSGSRMKDFENEPNNVIGQFHEIIFHFLLIMQTKHAITLKASILGPWLTRTQGVLNLIYSKKCI